MKQSLQGHRLPESHEEALELAHSLGQAKFKNCFVCGISLNSKYAAYSPAGWCETQISGTCEPCFDKLFADPDD